MGGDAEQSDLILVLGGIHAGRHNHARTLAADSGLPLSEPKTDPIETILGLRRAGALLLIPDIGPWLAAAADDAAANLLAAIDETHGPLILVSREAGLGIVPLEAAARRGRDDLGRLNQALARRAGQVVFVAAGLPLILKAAR